MADYTWNDVIIDPTSEEARTAIGKKCYMYDSPTSLVMLANNNGLNNLLTLGSIDAKSESPFVDKEYGFGWSCIIVKKEESYKDRAKKWVEDNNLEVGDYVRVTRKAGDYEDGWSYLWDYRMNNSVGKILRVEEVKAYYEFIDIDLEDSFCYPYFVLEKVEGEELYSEHLKRWIEDNNVKAGDYVKVTRTIDSDDEHFNAVWIDEMTNCVGRVMRVLYVDDYSGITLENNCIFPYFVLEKVEEPKPKYVPFTSKEEFIEAFHYHDNANYSETEDILMNYGMWIKSKDEGHFRQVTIIKASGIYTNCSYNLESWEDLLNEYTFLDGAPCGKEVSND